MSSIIAILEDNADRRGAMAQCLPEHFPEHGLRFFVEAAEMIRFLDRWNEDVGAICLDHDLEPQEIADGDCSKERTRDPGTGRDVVERLVADRPFCPIVVHSSNMHAAIGMVERLRETGWKVFRVVPCDDLAWIPTEWPRMVRKAMKATSRSWSALEPARGHVQLLCMSGGTDWCSSLLAQRSRDAGAGPRDFRIGAIPSSNRPATLVRSIARKHCLRIEIADCPTKSQKPRQSQKR